MRNYKITRRDAIGFSIGILLFLIIIITFVFVGTILSEKYPQILTFEKAHPALSFLIVAVIFLGVCFLIGPLFLLLGIFRDYRPKRKASLKETVVFIMLFMSLLLCYAVFYGLYLKYPGIRRFVNVHPFGVLLIAAFLILMGVSTVIFISIFKDRNRFRCPKCRTKYKDFFMDFEPGKVISKFKCTKCGYEGETTEVFDIKKYEGMFNDAVESGMMTPDEKKQIEELAEKKLQQP